MIDWIETERSRIFKNDQQTNIFGQYDSDLKSSGPVTERMGRF